VKKSSSFSLYRKIGSIPWYRVKRRRQEATTETVASSLRNPALGLLPMKGELHPGDLVIVMPMGVQPGERVRPVRMSHSASMAGMSGSGTWLELGRSVQ